MSISAMNWAWQLRLKPTVKFVLMALADACDDQGYCWPSVPTIAYKTCLDDRSVQRILNTLKADGLVEVQKRFRKDGSPSSNSYRLPINTPGDKLSPPLPDRCRQVVTPMSPPGDAGVTLTTTETIIEPKQPPPSDMLIETSGSGLIFPRQFSEREIAAATRKLNEISPDLAQELLDELSGRLNTIRGSPISYLRSLIERAKAGTFTPEIGIRVAQARERDKEMEALKTHKQPLDLILSPTVSPERIDALRKAISMKPHYQSDVSHGASQ